MGVFAFDTHKAVKQLKDAGFNDDQAETVTTLFWDTRVQELENLVTKDDLAAAEARLRTEIATVKADLIKWFVPLMVGQVAVIAALVKVL